jgi:hypothetical protein
MDNVSVKFYDDRRWSIDIEHQIQVSKNEIVHNLSRKFALRVVEKKAGEIITLDKSVYSFNELNRLDMDELRNIASSYNVKARSKDKIIEKIIKNQIYNKDYLTKDIDSTAKQEEIIYISECKEIKTNHEYDSLLEIVELIIDENEINEVQE